MDPSVEMCTATPTYARLLADASVELAAAGVGTARLDAEVLLAAACGSTRSALYGQLREAAPPDVQGTFRSMVARRAAREPLQYIVGHQEFWSLDFVVTPDVLIPRPETELLVEVVLSSTKASVSRSINSSAATRTMLSPLEKGDRGGFVERPLAKSLLTSLFQGEAPVPGGKIDSLLLSGDVSICDVGTGSGCIAIALATELPDAQIWALDISAGALAIAQQNAARHGVATRVRFVDSDLFTAVPGQRFDVVVCNPPYVRSADAATCQPELQWEPRQALYGGESGLAIMESLVASAPDHLLDDGRLVMEIGAGQETAVTALVGARFRHVEVRNDLAGIPRVLLATV